MKTQTGGRTDRHDEANNRFSQFFDAVSYRRTLTRLSCRLCENFRNGDWFAQRVQREVYRDFLSSLLPF
jgi:hypothetical protein